MKISKKLPIMAISLIVCACNQADPRFTGTYILNFKNEYTITNDTLIIEPYNEKGGTYKLQRKAGYRLIRDGKILPKQFSEESWMATYNKDKQVLQETEFGRQVFIGTDGLSATYNGTYRKLK